MAMDGNGLSVADAMALANGRDGGGLFGGGTSGGILALIIIFVLLFGTGSGFGFGGNGAAATQADIQRGFDTRTIVSKLDGITNGICDASYANANLINNVRFDTMQGFNSVNQGIANLGYEQQNCCCTTNRNIDSLKYENAQNTCAIVNAIHADGEATRALMQANTVQELRDKLQERDNTISNFMQSQGLLTALGRYVTNPPCYQGYNGYGYGYGCGCNTGVTVA
nr:MAG TPA: hypothetical protein [Siphoviridae sp. ctcBx5]